ncbi:MAG: conjugal transfer protein TraN, partial [Sphingobium sp. 32-64-5]
MKLRAALAGLIAMLALAAPAAAQMTVEEAREEGRALGNETRQDMTLVPTDDARAEAVPGYSGTSLPESAYFDNPRRMESDAASAKSTNEQYRITTDADGSRPTFSNAEILAATSRATSVENDPSTFLAGEEFSGTSGSCTPLPPPAGSDGYYETSCNTGSKVTTDARTCTVNLDVRTETRSIYTYYAGRMSTMPSDGG